MSSAIQGPSAVLCLEMSSKFHTLDVIHLCNGAALNSLVKCGVNELLMVMCASYSMSDIMMIKSRSVRLDRHVAHLIPSLFFLWNALTVIS